VTTFALLAVAAIVFVGAVLVGLRSWRLAIVALIVYIPVSGIAIDATYGHRLERAVAVLAKDFLFVLPAYAGFALWAWRRRERVIFPAAPVTLLFALAVIVVAQAFNPSVPKPLLALIGIKVWLFYVPLLFLGYHLVRTRDELFRLFGLMAGLALVPALIGLLEAALIYGGHAGIVYRAYGGAAAAVTQEYVGLAFTGGGGHLRRIPSTFSSFYQYYLFLAVMLAVAYAWWRGQPLSRRRYVAAGAGWLLLVAASFATGVRAALFMTPFLVVLLLVLEGRSAARFALRWIVPVVAVVLVVATFVPGTHLVTAWTDVATLGRQEFWDVIVGSGRQAIHLTTFGLGTGIDSIAGRYAYPNDNAWSEMIFPLLGRWHESWYVRTWLELGVVGLVIVVALFGTLLVRGVRSHLAVHDPGLRVASAALLAVVAWSMLYAVKSQYLDLDPLNVYFWLFTGLLFKVPALAEPAPVEEEQPAATAPPPLETVAGQ